MTRPSAGEVAQATREEGSMDVTDEDTAAEREALGRLSEAAIALNAAEEAVAAARAQFIEAAAAVERLQAGSA